MPGRGVWPVLAVCLLAGCASVTAVDGQRYTIGSDAFRAYAERVFRAQNRAMSKLVFALDDASLGDAARASLEAAEAGLIGACGPLNEVAVRRRDDRGTRAGLGFEAARSVSECERALTDADRALATL